MKIIALLLTSVLMMAEVSAGEISSSENDVLLDSSFIHTFQKAMNECTEIRIEVEFLQTKNEFGNMSHHNNRCIGSKYCKCRVYSFDEFRSLQTAFVLYKLSSSRVRPSFPATRQHKLSRRRCERRILGRRKYRCKIVCDPMGPVFETNSLLLPSA